MRMQLPGAVRYFQLTLTLILNPILTPDNSINYLHARPGMLSPSYRFHLADHYSISDLLVLLSNPRNTLYFSVAILFRILINESFV